MTSTFPIEQRISGVESLPEVEASSNSFQPTFNISVTVSGSDAQSIGEQIAVSARESFEREWENFMHEKERRSYV